MAIQLYPRRLNHFNISKLGFPKYKSNYLQEVGGTGCGPQGWSQKVSLNSYWDHWTHFPWTTSNVHHIIFVSLWQSNAGHILKAPLHEAPHEVRTWIPPTSQQQRCTVQSYSTNLSCNQAEVIFNLLVFFSVKSLITISFKTWKINYLSFQPSSAACDELSASKQKRKATQYHKPMTFT